ncbi:MAG: beta-N-acetylhexosaminidase [Anaerolineae bacterium]|nr:beta-N-acetylhexosaminidase [Anaerolineae bacterium]
MDGWIEDTLTQLSLEARIGQMMMVGFDGLAAPAHILEWLAAGRAGSVVLFARNIAAPQQVKDLTDSLRAAALLPILICTDQEGGIVARLRAAQGFTESPGNMALGAIAHDADGAAARTAQMLAQEMHAVGIDWALAPCLDILSNLHNPVVSTRSLGSDPHRVAQLGAALVRGFQAGGVTACAKHFPGHGNTRIDSHVDLPAIASSLSDLGNLDLVPFRAAIEAGVGSVMIAHIVFSALDPDRPATLAPAVQQDLLREQLGFNGVITTDCMEMRAVADRYGAGESTVLAALAGADSIVHSHTRARQEAAYEAMLDAARSGRLPERRIEASARRLLKLKALHRQDTAPGQREPLGAVGSAAHYALGLEAARAALVLVRGNLPALAGRRVALIEFGYAMRSQAEEAAGAMTDLQRELAAHAPGLQSLLLSDCEPSPEQLACARQLAGEAEVLILATRSAHLSPPQQALAAELLVCAGGDVVLLCLRNPWDAAALPGAPNVLATLGDARPSLQAAAEALAGEVTPVGKLPVPLA